MTALSAARALRQRLAALVRGPASRPPSTNTFEWEAQAPLVSELLVSLMALSVFATAVIWAFGVDFRGGARLGWLSLGAGALNGAAYVVNRAGRHRAAAFLAVGISTAFTWVSFLVIPHTPALDVTALAYLTLPPLMAGLLLPVWPTLAIVGGSWLVVFWRDADRLTTPVEAAVTAIYLIVVSLVILASTSLRNRRAAELARRSRALAESVMQFQNAFQYASIGMALVAPDGRWLRANSSLCTLLGYTETELQQLDFQTVTHPDDLETSLNLVRKVIAGEMASYQIDKRYYTKQRKVVWTTLSVSLVRAADGTPQHFVSQVQDITARKQAEDALRASEARFRTLSESSPLGIYQTDAQGRDVYQNARWLEMTGMSAEAAQGDGWLRAVHPEDRAALAAEWARTVGLGQPFSCEFRLLDPNGQVHWVHSRATPMRDNFNQVTGYVGTVSDITERKVGEQALQGATERMAGWVSELEQNARDIGLLNELNNLLQSCLTAQEAYSILKQIGRQLFPQQAGQLAITNASRNLVETVAAWDAADPLASAEAAAFAPTDCWALRRGRPYWYETGPGAVRCAHLGQASASHYLCVPMMAHGETLGVLHLRAVAGGTSDLSPARRNYAQTVADSISLAVTNLRLREHLRDQSIRDVLTGLFNRRYLEETLERELGRAERDQVPAGVLMLDIDHFKRFNDDFGHSAGDEVLRALGRLLVEHTRVDDIACRYGGEEFTLVLPRCSLEIAVERAEQLRAQAHALRVTHAGQSLGSITLSVGVAVFPEHGASAAAIVNAADRALYRAKQAGRNRVVAAVRLVA